MVVSADFPHPPLADATVNILPTLTPPRLTWSIRIITGLRVKSVKAALTVCMGLYGKAGCDGANRRCGLWRLVDPSGRMGGPGQPGLSPASRACGRAAATA